MCSRRHRVLLLALLAVLVPVVVTSGVAGAMRRWDWSLWPWNRGWFMFATSDGRFYQLQFEGHLEDGSDIRVNLGRWFKFPVGFETARWNEIDRNAHALAGLLQYVCHRYNVEAAPGHRMVRIASWDLTWPQGRGLRTHPADALQSQEEIKVYLPPMSCD